MTRFARSLCCLIAACGGLGCDGTFAGNGTPDAGGGVDAGAVGDAGGNPTPDAGAVLDAGRRDAGGTDAGSRTDAGGAADAGAPDAGARDAGSCAGALLCDDFEAYPAGGPPKGLWSVSTNGGSVVVDGVHTHSGTRAVHISTPGGSGGYHRAYMAVTGSPIFPVAGDIVYGRMMVWLTAAPTQVTHWSNIQGDGPVPGQSFRASSRYGGQYSPKLMANYDTSGVSSDCWQHSQTAIPTQQWACFEWRFATPTNEMDFWLDGVSLTDLTVLGQGSGCIANGTNGKWLLPQYEAMNLGWEHYQVSDPIDMWIDDVALDTRRIGCPP